MFVFKCTALTLLILTALSGGINACHPRGHGNEDEDDDEDIGDAEVLQRRKRQAPVLPLEEFFAQCMGSFFPYTQTDLRTIVDYTIRQTSWFRETDRTYCPSDTVDCWRNVVTDYITPLSQLWTPAKRCMEQYGILRNKPATSADTRILVQVPPFASTLPLDIKPLEFEQQLRQTLPPSNDPTDQSFQNIRSLINFFKDDTICALDYCDCTGVSLAPGEACGQYWYTRVAALTKPGSPARPAVVAVTNQAISNAMNSQSSSSDQQSQGQSNPLSFMLQYMLMQEVMKSISGSSSSGSGSSSPLKCTYYYYESLANYATAETACTGDGAILASFGIRTQTVRDILVSRYTLVPPILVGLKTIAGTWTWADGEVESASSSLWKSGEPTPADDCAFWDVNAAPSTDGVLSGTSCTSTANFLCEDCP